MVSTSIICRSRRLRQIIDVRDTGKSRYFVITEFNNCFIIRSPSLFFNEYLREAKRSAFFHAITYHACFRLRINRILFAAKHSWMTLRMSRLLFVGSFCRWHGGLSANEKEEKFASNDNSHWLDNDLLKFNWILTVVWHDVWQCHYPTLSACEWWYQESKICATFWVYGCNQSTSE